MSLFWMLRLWLRTWWAKHPPCRVCGYRFCGYDQGPTVNQMPFFLNRDPFTDAMLARYERLWADDR